MKPVKERLLLVEGASERRLIPELIEANGVEWVREGQPVVFIEEARGFDELVKPGLLQAHLKAPGRRAVGVITDTDELTDGRWTELRRVILRADVDVPEVLPPGGLVLSATPQGPRFGVWMMPDNQSRGMLETFLHALVRDPADPLWAFTATACDEAKDRHNAAITPHNRDKARVHTWLAWQKEPGLQLHVAVKQRHVLDPRAPGTQPFVAWFCDLFGLTRERPEAA